jgi:hypothetical protein
MGKVFPINLKWLRLLKISGLEAQSLVAIKSLMYNTKRRGEWQAHDSFMSGE